MIKGFARFFRKIAIGIAAVTVVGTTALAQEDAEEAVEEDEVIDEVVVTAGSRSGDAVDVEALYREMMRDRLMIDLNRLHELQDQNEWRSSANEDNKEPSRIKWGYKPQDDLRMGRGSDLSESQFITTKPASLFRFEF